MITSNEATIQARGRRRSSGALAEHRVEDPLMREHKPKVYILFEERETWTATLAIPIRVPKYFRGVLRFDGRLTGAIYCSKKHGKVHLSLAKRLTVPQLP